jgi:C4-type Zn-finger protein
MEKKELPDEKKEISCDNCEYKSSDIPVLREHIDVEHIIPYRKKV